MPVMADSSDVPSDAGALRGRAFDAVVVSATAASGSLAVGSLAPWALSRWVLTASLLLWFGAVLGAMATGARSVAGRARVSSLRPEAERTPGLILVTALSFASVALSASREVLIGVIREVDRYSDVIFNIDHRFILMHAWSILQRGGTSEALSMQGIPIAYHSGPAWLAAAAGSVFDTNPDTWLLLVFPISAVVTIVMAMASFLRSLGAGSVGAAVGVAVALSPLWERLRIDTFRDLAINILTRDWMTASGQVRDLVFGSTQTQMLNSLMGAAGALIAIAWFARRPTLVRFVVANGMVALSALAKPQYGIAGSILVFAVGVAMHRRSVRDVTLKGGVAIAGAFASLLLSEALIGGGNTDFLRPGTTFIKFPTSLRVVDPHLLVEPQFAVPAAAITVLLAVMAVRRRSTEVESRAAVVAVVSMVGLIAFWMLLNGVVTAQGEEAAGWAWNSMQVRLLVLPVVIGVTTVWLLAAVERFAVPARWILVGVLGIGVVSTANELVRESLDPVVGHEAIDARPIRELLAGVNPDGSLLISSDLSDPAQFHRRAGRAFYLSNAYGHQFWLTQTGYGYAELPETSRRRDAIERFFATPWSRWHRDLLVRSGATHLIVADRCPAAWDPGRVPMLTETVRVSGWTLLEVAPASSLWAYSGRFVERSPAFVPAPTFGDAPCR